MSTRRHGMRRAGWKLVRPDGRTRNDFVWPLVVGAEVRSDHDPAPHSGACPKRPGDGLSVALTASGLALAGFASPTLLKVEYDAADVRGGDIDKVRVLGPVTVVSIIDWHRAIREGDNPLSDLREADLCGADLRGADLYRADLREADLCRADLRGANLGGAYLYRADLRGANLGGAYLRGADLYGANLRGADPYRADLGGADLRGADLRGANLRGADFRGANLGGAYLGGADLRGAYLGQWERGPDGHVQRREQEQ